MLRSQCLVLLLAAAACAPPSSNSKNTGGTSAGGTTGNETTGGTTSGTTSSTSGSTTLGGGTMTTTTGGNSNTVTFTGPSTRFIGRPSSTAGGTLFAWSGTAAETRFTGSQLTVSLSNAAANQANRVSMYIDGALVQTFYVVDSAPTYSFTVAQGTHTAQLVKITEAGTGEVVFGGFSTDGTLLATQTPSGRVIEFVGDSITAGYGDEATDPNLCNESPPNGWSADPNFENVLKAYGPVTAQALNADWSVVAWSGKGVYVNRNASDTVTMPQLFPLTNPTSTTSTYNYNPQANVVVIDLCTNDFYAMSQGNSAVIPTSDQAPFTTAYTNLIQQVRTAYPNAYIIVALGPMLSHFYPAVQDQLTLAENWLQAMVTTVQKTDPKVSFLEFPVNAADYGCDDHPNAAYQAIMSQQLSTAIQQLTGW